MNQPQSQTETPARDLNYPFEAQLEKLRECGVLLRQDARCVNPHHHTVDAYNVFLNPDAKEGGAEPLHITKQVAEVLAELFNDPRMAKIDIPFVSAVDEDAKPILAKAIHQWRGLDAAIGYECLTDATFDPEVPAWFDAQFVKSKNPNFMNSSIDGKLGDMAYRNQNDAVDLMLAMERKPGSLDKATYERAAERMPILLAMYAQHRGNWSGHSMEGTTARANSRTLLRLQTVAKSYGVEIALPTEITEVAQNQAIQFTEGSPHSYTAQPRIKHGHKLEESSVVHRNRWDTPREASYRLTPYQRILSERQSQDQCEIKAAEDVGQYPVPRRSR